MREGGCGRKVGDVKEMEEKGGGSRKSGRR